MRTSEYAIDINKPLDTVYRFAIDPGHMSDWIVNGKGQLSINGNPLEIGSTYTVHQGDGENKRRDFVFEVLALEQDSLMAIKSGGRLLTYTLRRSFVEKDLKTTTVTEYIEMDDPPGLAKLLGGYMMGKVKKVHHDGLRRLKQALEQEPA